MLGRAELSVPEKLRQLPKNCYATCKVALPDSHHPIFIGFWALHIAGRDEFRAFVV